MIKVLLLFLSLSTFFSLTYALPQGNESQCGAKVELSPDGKPIAVYNLMQSYPTYGKKRLMGTIIRVEYDKDTELNILGFVLELDNNVRQEIDVTHDNCIPNMSKVDRSWIPYIIRKGNRVRVDAEISGSAGFANARNIFVLKKFSSNIRRGK